MSTLLVRSTSVLAESRQELLREAQHWLEQWEDSRSEEALGRLLQALDDLALLVRARG